MPVDVGIGGDDDLVVAQAIEALFDVERRLEEMKFLNSRR